MKKLLSILFVFFMMCGGAWGADQADFPAVYIDADAGDGGVGSQADPYNDLSDINWTTGGDNSIFDYLAGSPSESPTINLQKGDTWREQVSIATAGTATYPIVIGAYGTGDDPIISGADLVTGWSVYVPDEGDLIEDDFDDGDLTGWTAAGATASAVSTDQSYTSSYSVKTLDEYSYFYKAWADTNDAYFRGYVYLDNHPSSGNGSIIGVYRDATFLGAFYITTSGSLRYWNQIAGAAYTDATVIAEDTWTLVELYWKLGDGAGGNVVVKINGSTTINETNVDNGAGQIDRFRVGIPAEYNGDGPVYWDNVGHDSTDWMGAIDPDVYSKTLAAEPASDEVQSVWESDTPSWYTVAASAAAVDDSGEFYYDADTDTLIIQTSDDAAPSTHTINASVRLYGISRCGAPYDTCTANYITINGLTIEGANEYGIFFNDASNMIVSNNTVRYCGEQGIYIRNNPGGSPDPVTTFDIFGNTVYSVGDDPTEQDASKCGILVEGSDTSTIYQNTVYNIYGPGIRVTAQDGEALLTSTSIYENDVSDCINQIYVYRTEGANVFRNHVYDGKSIGIFIGADSNDAEVYYNIIHDLTCLSGATSFNGIDINNAEDGVAYGNTISTICGGSIIIDDSGNNADGWVFKNNILDAENNTDPGAGASAYTMYIDSDVGTCTSDYNLHYYPTGNEGGNFIYWIGTTYTPAQWSTFVSAKSQEANGIGASSDPLFTNPGSDDFTLQDTSPCRNVGIDLGASYDDALDPTSTWPSGVATLDQDDYNDWDIGAYIWDTILSGKGIIGLRFKFGF